MKFTSMISFVTLPGSYETSYFSPMTSTVAGSSNMASESKLLSGFSGSLSSVGADDYPASLKSSSAMPAKLVIPPTASLSLNASTIYLLSFF